MGSSPTAGTKFLIRQNSLYLRVLSSFLLIERAVVPFKVWGRSGGISLTFLEVMLVFTTHVNVSS